MKQVPVQFRIANQFVVDVSRLDTLLNSETWARSQNIKKYLRLKINLKVFKKMAEVIWQVNICEQIH